MSKVYLLECIDLDDYERPTETTGIFCNKDDAVTKARKLIAEEDDVIPFHIEKNFYITEWDTTTGKLLSKFDKLFN